jgi:hypothetical protein
MAYKRFTLLDPVVMYKEDLLEQKELLRDHLICEGANFTVNAKSHGEDISAKPVHAVDELFNEEFPEEVDQLVIDARMLNEDGSRITKNVRLMLDHKMADLRVYSETDREWVEQTSRRLNEFYESKRPWYSGLKKGMAPLFNLTMIFALFLSVMAWSADNRSLIVLPVILLLYSLLGLTMGLKNITFPYCRILFYEKKDDSRSNYELFSFLGWVALLALNIFFIVL